MHFEWGDISPTDYRSKDAGNQSGTCTLLPDPDKLLTFDQVADVVASLGQAIDATTSKQLKELLRLLVLRVITANREVAGVEMVPAALPLFPSATTLLVAPPERRRRPLGKVIDPLAWYADRGYG